MEENNTNNLLVAIDNSNPLQIFTEGGADSILKGIEDIVNAFVPDVSSQKGRDEIKSIAHKVARSKTMLDGLGKDLVSDWKNKSKLVDKERKAVRDKLDAIKEKVRRPLTEYEQAQEARIQLRKDKIQDIQDIISSLDSNFDIEDEGIAFFKAAESKLSELKAFNWDEFEARANVLIQDAAVKLNENRTRLNNHFMEKRELEALRKEKQLLEQKQRDEAIAIQAAAAAKKEAEKIALEKQQQLEAEKMREKEKAEQAEREKQAAIVLAKKAQDQAKADAEMAVKRERERVELEKEEEARKQAERDRDKKHRAQIHNDILDALMPSVGCKDIAKAAIRQIINGEIPHVKITY